MRFPSIKSTALMVLTTLAAVLPCRALDWSVELSLGNEIYPSAVIGLSGLKENFASNDENEFGDPLGMIYTYVTAPSDNCRVKVTIEATSVFKESSITVTLPTQGTRYRVAPMLRYDIEKLLKVKQSFPDYVKVMVETDEESDEQTKKITVRSINDCLLGMKSGGEYIDTKFMFAAYVNENNPYIDQILGYALKKEYVTSFKGYQGDAESVFKEVAAIYQTLQDLKFHYSSITESSGEEVDIRTQHVRFVGESLNTSQANCIDGTVIFASVFKKLGLHPVIITVPGHAFVGVYLTKDKNMETLCPIETTMVGSRSVQDAVNYGMGNIKKHWDEFQDEKNRQCMMIDVREARSIGISPIPEAVQ